MWQRALLTAVLTLCTTLPAWAVSIPSVASGEAENREAALTSALRHAVEQVVGMSVDSNTYVNNLKSIQDRIYTRADGYVESYKVVDEEGLPGGRYRLTVSALISKEKLSAAVNPLVGDSAVQLDGKLLLQNAKLELSNQKAVERQFKSLLDEMADPNNIKVTYKLKTSVSTEKQDEVFLTFNDLEVTFNPAWYKRLRAFMVSLKKSPHAQQLYKNYLLYSNFYAHAGGQLYIDLLDEEGNVLTGHCVYDSYWCNPFYGNEGPQHLGRNFENWINPPALPPQAVSCEKPLTVAFKATHLAETKSIAVRIFPFSMGKWPVPLS